MALVAAPTRANLDAFGPGVSEGIGVFAYPLIDPRDGEVYYVGKGTGDRCFAPLAEARQTRADTVGDYAKLARIGEIEAAGAAVRIDIPRHGLSDHEADLVESAAIDLLGPQRVANRVAGHDAAALGRGSVAGVNALYGATPVRIDPEHRVVLARINRRFQRGMSEEELYEATRGLWKVGPRARQLGTASAPERAMAVLGGVVRAVYRIDAWEQATSKHLAVHPEDGRRWGFHAMRDAAMEMIYLHRDVSLHLRAPDTGRPAQNPIRYVNGAGCAEKAS